MSRRSKPSGSTAPAPAVIRYLSWSPPVVVSSRMREATVSAACAKSSMTDRSYRGGGIDKRRKSETVTTGEQKNSHRYYGTLPSIVHGMKAGTAVKDVLCISSKAAGLMVVLRGSGDCPAGDVTCVPG